MPNNDISSVRSSSASLAAGVRWNSPNVHELRRDLRASKLAAHIDAVVAAAPPITPEQAKELARLLAPRMIMGSLADAA